LPNASEIEINCVRDYCKYSDTVAVCFAIYNLISKNPNIARFIGIEHNLQNSNGTIVTPDIVATFDSDRKGLMFEMKWSLPLDDELLEKEIKELKKYAIPSTNWRKDIHEVDTQDLILICHIDDVKRVIEMVKNLSQNADQSHLAQEGFAVWSWTITPSKAGERKEELRLFPVYGKTRNQKIEELINQPGGILIPEGVLTYLRFTFTFIKEKPPIQYTMTVLIQNILSTFQRSPERESYNIHIDSIYERAKTFFPSWHEYDTSTIQMKRRWIREALEELHELGLCDQAPDKDDLWKIPIPILRTRKPIQQVLCKKMARAHLKQERAKKKGRPGVSVVHPKATKKNGKITHYFN
jgi:hypothetical protein